MITAALNIARSIAEIEASVAGFSSIRPAHFWIGSCKECDLDLAKFLEVRKRGRIFFLVILAER